MPQERQTLKTVLISAVTSLIVVVIALSVFSVTRRQNIPDISNQGNQISNTASGEATVIGAVKKANPAVVSIIITKDEPVLERYNDGGPVDFFGGLLFPQYRQNGTQRVQIGGGSGFLVSADGLIVTNKHVVSDSAAEYTVYTNDGRKHAAKVVAKDPSEDIAVIKISGSGYPYLTFDDSSKLELGQSVVAIGNALGEFRNTVSVGVISGLSRSIVAGDVSGGTSEQLNEVIQTDAAINPGNSGGPLLNLNGNVVGVNVAVAAGSQSIGFALPALGVANAVESVKASGTIVHPYIGVRYIPVTEDVQTKYKLSVDYGVYVTSGPKDEPAVIPGSPAAKAGIASGDVILEINSTKITEDVSLASLIKSKKVGDTVTLTVLHQGKEKIVTLTLEANPEK
jgi:serine protease Do